MLNINALSDLSQGDTAIIMELTMSGSIRRRLQDIGLIPGTRVECLQKSPLGDPVAYIIRGAVIAIRREDASGVIIENKPR